MQKGLNKRAQITVFIILAIVIIGAIAGYFLVKKPFVASVPPALAPAYNYYISCVEGIAKTGADIMARQGGYLELPEFKAGTTYAPFSSELGFMEIGRASCRERV